MSIAAISYSSLSNASSEASSVARKLGSYASSLETNVYNKLNSYSGEWTSSLSVARSKTLTKINDLEADQTNYEKYATALTELKSECQTVDRAVKSMVSTLTASFKEAYGISNNVVTNSISYFYTSVTNSTWLGRGFNTANDIYEAETGYLKDGIKEWYNYDGGEELIKGISVALLEMTLAVIAIATGGLAAAILGIIALVNSMVNLHNEIMAYGYANTFNDPATAYRRREIDTMSDYLRSSFVYNDLGFDTDDFDEFYDAYSAAGSTFNAIALGIEVVTVVCTIITFVSGLASMYSSITKGFNTIDTKSTVKSMFEKMGKTLKDKFLNFGTDADSLKPLKSILTIEKTVMSGDMDIKTLFVTTVTDVLLPTLTGFTTIDSDGESKERSLTDFYKSFESGWKLLGEEGSIEKLLNPDSAVDLDILEKLTSTTDINISVPEISITISVPQISANVAIPGTTCPGYGPQTFSYIPVTSLL